MNRRCFLGTVAAGASALAGAAARGGRMIPIVDTHQHLWDLDRFKLAWMKPGEDPLGKSYRPSDYAKATEGLGVVKTYAGPVSNDAATITFKQAIAANEPLRTGSYSKTLTFTLSTTNP